MIVDTSAIIALLLREPEGPAIARLVTMSPVVRMSAAGYVELGIVADRRRDPGLTGAIDPLIDDLNIRIEPLTEQQARIARTAFQRFGKGTGHPARLNMGDCFAYALARDLGEPLLFKGGDFTHTDIELVTTPYRQRRLSEVVASYGASPT